MFKTLTTLIRGAAAKAEEDFADRHALLILDQQIRDAAAATERAKRALAIAIAQDEAEGKRLEATLKRIADLEERATAALAGGRDDLATEAAEAIALMEADRDAIRKSRARFRRRRRAAQDRGGQCRPSPGRARTRPAHRAGDGIGSAPEAAQRHRRKRGNGRAGRRRSARSSACANGRPKRPPRRRLRHAGARAQPGRHRDRLEAAGYGRRTRADRGRRARAAARESRHASHAAA